MGSTVQTRLPGNRKGPVLGWQHTRARAAIIAGHECREAREASSRHEQSRMK
jgi:hypothetical protein